MIVFQNRKKRRYKWVFSIYRQIKFSYESITSRYRYPLKYSTGYPNGMHFPNAWSVNSILFYYICIRNPEKLYRKMYSFAFSWTLTKRNSRRLRINECWRTRNDNKANYWNQRRIISFQRGFQDWHSKSERWLIG